ncbi:MAG: hypothetical protein ABEJ23_01100 [Haloarculaceae archaeon]
MADDGSLDGLPRPRYGFDSAAGGTADLPADIRDIENPLATVAPHLSQFVLYVDPTRPEHMRYFQTFALAEEMMHGRRHRFGLTRSHHLAVYRSLLFLYRYVDGELDAQTAAANVVKYDRTCRSIHAKRASVLETIDRYLCQSVMDEPGYLDRHIDGYLEANPDLDRATVEERFDSVQQVFREAARGEDEDLFEQLQAIEERYNRRVAETVADTALDVPYLIAPLEVQGYASVDLRDLDLRDRFDAATTALTELPVDDPGQVDSDVLRRDVVAQMSDPVGEATGERHPRDLTMPLLDVPQQVDPEETVQDRYDAIMEAPTAIGRVINAAFRFTGNFGGAVYRIPDERGSPTNNWFVNPLIDDEPVGPTVGHPPLRGAETYQELWGWVFVGDGLIEQLLDRRETTARTGVRCPLCAVSMGGQCGGDRCTYAPLIDRLDDRRDPLLDAIEAFD